MDELNTTPVAFFLYYSMVDSLQLHDISTHAFHPPSEPSTITIHPRDILTPVQSVQVFLSIAGSRWTFFLLWHDVFPLLPFLRHHVQPSINQNVDVLPHIFGPAWSWCYWICVRLGRGGQFVTIPLLVPPDSKTGNQPEAARSFVQTLSQVFSPHSK